MTSDRKVGYRQRNHTHESLPKSTECVLRPPIHGETWLALQLTEKSVKLTPVVIVIREFSVLAGKDMIIKVIELILTVFAVARLELACFLFGGNRSADGSPDLVLPRGWLIFINGVQFLRNGPAGAS